MKKEDLRIVFMGTPEFAVESLRVLVEGGYNVVGAVTMPDKASGRHQSEPSPSPVKRYALGQGLKVLQPDRLKDPSFLDELRALRADLQVVVAFRMLPECVWAMPPMGTFNLHASLLPQYRGAAPINWAVIRGETETGLTTFFLKQEIDTGDIIRQVRIPIADTDTAGDVHDRLMLRGGQLVAETVDLILGGTAAARPQAGTESGSVLHAAPKIFKETCRIDWNAGVKAIYDFIRGLSPRPAAWTELHFGGETAVMKIYAAGKLFCTPTSAPGEVESDGLSSFNVATTDGYLSVKEIQLAGKRRMAVGDFLRGFHHAHDCHAV